MSCGNWPLEATISSSACSFVTWPSMAVSQRPHVEERRRAVARWIGAQGIKRSTVVDANGIHSDL